MVRVATQIKIEDVNLFHILIKPAAIPAESKRHNLSEPLPENYVAESLEQNFHV